MSFTRLGRRQDVLSINRDAFQWMVDRIEDRLQRGDLCGAALLISNASSDLQLCGSFADERLELALQALGQVVLSGRQIRRAPASDRLKLWHITTEVDSVGGHSVAIERWIRTDADCCYSLLLTSQKGPVPERIAKAVEESGGRVYCCRHSGMQVPVETAREIVSVIDGDAHAVLLQLYTGDISGLLPFCSRGGPSVGTYNTADHKACLGVCVSDLFLEIRGSGRSCTESLRGCPRTAILPLLVEPRKIPSDDERQRARAALNVSDSSCCLLSIGSGYKYKPLDDLSFQACAADILHRTADTVLLVVGPSKDEDWAELVTQFGDRVRLLGRVEDLELHYSAADIYIEGFPFGSLTALLDARQVGCPCVLSPLPVRPPYSSDSPGLADICQPESTVEYVNRVCSLVSLWRSGATDRRMSPLMSQHHPEMWRTTLKVALTKLLEEHQLYAVRPEEPPESFSAEFWPSLLMRSEPDAYRCNLWRRLLDAPKDEWIIRNGSRIVSSALQSVNDKIQEDQDVRTLASDIMAVASELQIRGRCGVSVRCFLKLFRLMPRETLRFLRPIFKFGAHLT